MSAAKSKWNVYAVVDGKPIAIQNAAPLTYWNARNMARRLEASKYVSRVLITRHSPSCREPISALPAASQERVMEEATL